MITLSTKHKIILTQNTQSSYEQNEMFKRLNQLINKAVGSNTIYNLIQ